MPALSISTNVMHIDDEFKYRASRIISKILDKPLEQIAVHVKINQDICFGKDSSKLAALCELTSVGGLNVEVNKKLSKDLMDLMAQSVNLDSTRVYINFTNVHKSNLGFNKTTIDDYID